jgi:hypothetical protein
MKPLEDFQAASLIFLAAVFRRTGGPLDLE